MPNLSKIVNTDEGVNFPIYTVIVNDGGADGGNNLEYNVTVGMSGIELSNLEAAVQAFAASLGSIPGYTLVSTKKVAITEIDL